MASDDAKGGSTGADPGNGVLGNLPSTRPARMSRRREAGGAGAEAPKRATTVKSAAPAKPEAAAAPKPKPRAAAEPKAAAEPRSADRPRAVRSGSPSLKTGPKPAPPRPEPGRPPSGPALVTTAVQAAGELAQIGLSFGGRAVKRAVSRIPKP